MSIVVRMPQHPTVTSKQVTVGFRGGCVIGLMNVEDARVRLRRLRLSRATPHDILGDSPGANGNHSFQV